MKYQSGASLVLILHATFCVPNLLAAATTKFVSQDHAVASTVIWKSTSAEHVYGFPYMKPNKKGSLTLSADALTFSGKSGNMSIPRSCFNRQLAPATRESNSGG